MEENATAPLSRIDPRSWGPCWKNALTSSCNLTFLLVASFFDIYITSIPSIFQRPPFFFFSQALRGCGKEPIFMGFHYPESFSGKWKSFALTLSVLGWEYKKVRRMKVINHADGVIILGWRRSIIFFFFFNYLHKAAGNYKHFFCCTSDSDVVDRPNNFWILQANEPPISCKLEKAP